MRKGNDAPVDTMGASQLADPKATPNEFAFQTLVSLMLSSQTKDQVNAEAMGVLRENGLSIKMIIEVEEKELNKMIEKVGFHNKKAKYIKDATQIIIDKHEGKVPSNFDSLLDLPGVGPKMAHLLLQQCFDQTIGISVDTHVHRIANRLKWVPAPTPTPEKTAEALQEWLPKEKWSRINEMLVGFGQTICKPLYPKCYECKAKDICPYEGKLEKQSGSKSKSKVEIVVEEEVKETEIKQESEKVEMEGGKESKKRKIDALDSFKFETKERKIVKRIKPN